MSQPQTYGTKISEEKRNEISFKILVALLRQHKKESPTLGKSSTFAVRAVADELHSLFQSETGKEELAKVINVSVEQLEVCCRKILCAANLHSQRV